MSGIGILVPDILSEIMRRLPSDIDQKFAFSQVSRYWRDVALHDHLFWSSFSGGRSKADCYRIPTILERSGSAMLHVQFRFSDGHTPLTDWHAYATEALVPHVERIETLDVEFWLYSSHSLSPRAVQALLNSGLEFPALQTLRLEGPEYGHAPSTLLTAPQLRTLDVERFKSSNWVAFWSPSLESIRLHGAWDVTLQTLLDISDRCPRARRVGLEMGGHSSDDLFEALARRRPLAPALRELELITPELGLILKAGFSDVLLHTITGCLYNADIDVLAEALLPGVGPLVIYDLDSSMQQLELCDNNGRIRRFQCWNEDSSFEVDWAWEHLCNHYKLHETVQEIRTGIAYCQDYRWNQYAEVIQNYPPQLPHGITLVFAMPSYTYFSPTEEEEDGDSGSIPRMICIPGLAKVTFEGTSDGAAVLLDSALEVLAHIEPPRTRKVDVCIHSLTMLAKDTVKDPFGIFQAALSGDCWTICTQCTNHCIH